MATLTVGPGSTFPSVAAAMAVAAPGDTIELESGYSNETATVSVNNLTLSGNASSTGIVLQLALGVPLLTMTGTAPFTVLDAADDNTIVGSTSAVYAITVTNGVDVLQNFNGNDTLTVDYRAATQSVTGNSNTGFSEAGGGRSVTFPQAVPMLVTAMGGSGNDSLYHPNTDGYLVGGPGADGHGGPGWASYATSTSGVTASMRTPANNTGNAAGDTYVSITGLVGSSFDDVLELPVLGDANGPYRISGGAGSDRLIGTSISVDLLDGGAGLDFADYSTDTVGLQASLNNPSTNTGSARNDVYTSIEGLIGSNFNDTLSGDTGDNELRGGGGNDTLRGEAGINHLVGGAGGDTLIGNNGQSLANYATSASGLTASLANPVINTGDAAGDSYLSIMGLIGSAFGDTLTLHNAARSIWALQGDDTLFGGSDNDDLHGQDGNDMLAGGGGINHLDGGAGGDVLEGAGGLSFASYANALGGVDANMISPGANAGEAAGDSYFSIRGFIGSAFGDTLRLANTAGSIWAGDGNDFLFGSPGNDDLHGELGINHLNGGDGADALDGGGGWSFASYLGGLGVVANMANPAENTGNAAGDSYSSILGLVGSAFHDVLTLGNTAGSIWAHLGDDTLIGGAGADDLHGQDGNDALFGGGGADVLEGGNATAQGGPSHDIFVFGRGGANGDTVLDFVGNGAAAGDSLQFAHYGTAAEGATFTQVDATHWSINSADGQVQDIVTFANAAAIHVSDYLFV